MFPINTILHPTDFSERSGHAFALACSLARDHGARLVVLHVLTPSPVLPHEATIVLPPSTTFRDEIRERLTQLRPPPEVPVEYRIEEGDPVAQILHVAHEVGADLIALGTHGRTGIGRLAMGSVAEQVLRRATCPVLTVKMPFPADQVTG
jgi:nucleotide-binding universal stress UspA family protein